MKNKIFMACALVMLASCNNEDLTPGAHHNQSGDCINFSAVQDSETRTEYAANDWLQIDWNVDDQLTIWCMETQYPKDGTSTSAEWNSKTSGKFKVKSVIPTVNSAGKTTNSRANIVSVDASNDLYWSEGQHNFFAGYGADITAQTGKDGSNNDIYTGVFKCKYDKTQTLTQKNGAWVSMDQAYMVAKSTSAPCENIDLHFRPIMTTLEIDIKGLPSSQMYLSSVWVTIPATQDKTDANDYFYYDYASGTASNAASQTAETYKFNFSDQQQAVIPANGSIKVIAILPPITINPNEVTIQINSAGWGTLKTKVNKSVTCSYKARFQTEDWAYDTRGYADMGSCGKWALTNIGATYPTDLGYHLTWGYNPDNTKKNKSHYTAITYKASGDMQTASGLTWNTTDFDKGYDREKADALFYNVNLDNTYINASGNLLETYDLASQMFKDADGTISWRMPTANECMNLVQSTNIDMKWLRINGTAGALITCKTTGECIFLGAWGKFGQKSGTKPETFSTGLYYWSATREGDRYNSWILDLEPTTAGSTSVKINYKNDSSTATGNDYYRHHGMQVRAIKK